MYKACSRCGRIHDINYRCNAGRIYKGVRVEAEQVRYTTTWTKKAKAIKDASNNLCAVCLDNNILTYNGLEIHHIDKLTEAPEKAFDDDNLICLCKIHHRAADSGKIKKDYLRKLVQVREKF